MVMTPQPVFDALRSVEGIEEQRILYMSPRGKILDPEMVKDLSEEKEFTILCGHYEGIDERVIEEIVDEEISIGDYVITGGELPALILADSISRMLPGVLANEDAFTYESHFSSLLEYPQYTRPPVFEGLETPEILLRGYHGKVEAWRRAESWNETVRRRPDLI